MIRIEGDVIIERPVDEVFDFVADERNEPRYNPCILAVANPMGVRPRSRPAPCRCPARRWPSPARALPGPRRFASP
jgi:hypothetical protein